MTKSHFSLKRKNFKYTRYISFAQNETSNLNAVGPNMQTSREQINKIVLAQNGVYRSPRNSTAIAISYDLAYFATQSLQQSLAPCPFSGL